VSDVAGIEREELRKEIEAGDGLVLVDALAPMAFAHSHLPGAVNLIPEWVDARAPRLLPDRDAKIVVYCANPECDSSVLVARRLAELGYSGVRHYAGGKEEWRDAGLPLEGRRA